MSSKRARQIGNTPLATNTTSVWLCMKYEIPEMVKRQRAAIVNNGSVVGLVGLRCGRR